MKISNNLLYWFFIFAFCFIAYQQIIDNIRPNYSGESMVVKYLLGVAPNLFSAIGIPALFVVLIPQIKLKSYWINENNHLTANIISLTGLIMWEFVQKPSRKLNFDLNDILWTFIGAFIFHLIWTVTPEKFKEKYDET